MNNENLILEEIKGMRKDMNQNFQILQMLFIEHLNSTTANHQNENQTLEQDDSIQTQTSTNKVSNLHVSMIKPKRVENCEANNEGSNQITRYTSLHQDEDATLELNQRQVETPGNESKHLFHGVCTETEDRQEFDNIADVKESKFILTDTVDRYDGITGINDYQCHEPSMLDISYHTGQLDSQEEYIISNYVCQICNKCFPSESSLIEHVNNCKEDRLNQPTSSTSNNKLVQRSSREIQKIQGKLFQCDYCNKEFKYPSKLKLHLTTHTGEKPFECHFCHKTFSRSDHLKTHLRIHNDEKPFKCSWCSKVFSDSSNLRCHLRIHTGEKRFKCTYCTMSFIQSSTLKSHLRIHTGEKPFECIFCHKHFSLSCNLETHLRTHTGEKPFKCEFCPKTFVQSCNLKTHLRTHNVEKTFQCSWCEKVFADSSNLKYHLRNHTQESTYCPIPLSDQVL